MKTQRPFIEPYAETLLDVIESRAVLKFNPDDKVPNIIQRLRETDSRVGGVVDARGILVGIVTESGIIRRIFSRFGGLPTNVEKLCDHKAVRRLTAWDVMITHPDTLNINDKVEDALDVMTYLSHQYMPVVDSQKRLIAIVDVVELRRCLERKYGALKSLDDPISLYAIQQKLQSLNVAYSQTY